MKQYRSHKPVEAARIWRVWTERNAAEHVYGPLIACENPDGTVGQVYIPVAAEFFARGVPQPGDYLVRHQPHDHLSWLPKAVFEAGYREIAEGVDGLGAHVGGAYLSNAEIEAARE